MSIDLRNEPRKVRKPNEQRTRKTPKHIENHITLFSYPDDSIFTVKTDHWSFKIEWACFRKFHLEKVSKKKEKHIEITLKFVKFEPNLHKNNKTLKLGHLVSKPDDPVSPENWGVSPKNSKLPQIITSINHET